MQDSKSNRWGRAVAQSKYLTIISVTRTCTFNPPLKMKTMAGLVFEPALSAFEIWICPLWLFTGTFQHSWSQPEVTFPHNHPRVSHQAWWKLHVCTGCTMSFHKQKSAFRPSSFIAIEKKEFKRSLLYVRSENGTRMIQCSICWHKKTFSTAAFQ